MKKISVGPEKIVRFFSSDTLTGPSLICRCKRRVDANPEWQNFINAGSLNPQKARVLLQLALKKSPELEEARRIFETY